jgi:hypothetical protein
MVDNDVSRFFNGSIRDAGIYGRALSADELKANFLNTKTGSVPTPNLLYLKMKEGATDTVTSTDPIWLTMTDASDAVHQDVVLYYPYTRQWAPNVASVPKTALHFNGGTAPAPGDPTEGGSYIDVNDTINFNFTTSAFTVNFWLAPMAGGNYLFSNTSSTGGWYIELGSDGSISFGSKPTSASYVLTASSELAITQNGDAWHMVTCVWNGTKAFIYIDGIQVAVTGVFYQPGSSNNSLKIGQDGSGFNFYDGNLWQPQIWSSELSPSDIANLYFNQVQGMLWP